ncbi:MAG: glyoxylate/hydroxypyruvate reductase A [Thiotrichales bacterium]|nr:glyoxylate/hydroxypyruvate reductase A [Thiotrichales bacterium]MBT7150646.1 glyoxylate/hydroxypyruvate reductase A [Thiotrichales bacterium]MBT7438480.1 glyoxylate/hydroxypyruvate reductase A [Thiotrichales bacterium]MBT7933077.1 glyoxylate/hydroxypyruvate reductase A [Thiotrichales bacterium]
MEVWSSGLQEAMPEMDIKVYPDEGDVNDIEYAVVWKHPRGILKKYPNLKAILSLGAGVDHIISDSELPKGLPIVRLVDKKLTHEMYLHSLHWVLHFHSNQYLYRIQQQSREWIQQSSVQSEDRTIGIMGLGNIGKAIGDSLVNLDFKVIGWGARPKNSTGEIEYYYGHEQLSEFLSQTDILINILPLTENTKNILTKNELKLLPKGSFIINIGRGGIINENDLLSFLNSGHINAAALDVFAQEPLPENNSLWGHSSVYITPHIAGQSNPGSAAKTIAENIRLIEKGESPYPIYSLNSGY